MTQFKFYEVGGFIRDELLGVESKDLDFTVVGGTYDELLAYLKDRNFKIHLESPEHLTIRVGVPQGHPLYSVCKDMDFVLSRKDGPSFDGRRPEYVEVGTLEDDLRRRDFTVNALARDFETKELIDLFGGVEDCRNRVLRFVGDPMDRIREDGLRVIRAWRFEITKGFTLPRETMEALESPLAEEMLFCVKADRIREEFEKMFRFDTFATFKLLSRIPESMFKAIFRDGLRLSATQKD